MKFVVTQKCRKGPLPSPLLQPLHTLVRYSTRATAFENCPMSPSISRYTIKLSISGVQQKSIHSGPLRLFPGYMAIPLDEGIVDLQEPKSEIQLATRRTW